MTNEDKITIEPELRIIGRFCLHDLESGEEEWQEEENFYSVEERNGKTYVCYYTGWEDCPYEGYYVSETKEEVLALFKEVRDKISEAYFRSIREIRDRRNKVNRAMENILEEKAQGNIMEQHTETIETLKRVINNLRDLRAQTIKSDELNEEQLYYLQEGFREGLAASAIHLAGIVDSYLSEEYGPDYPIGMISMIEDEWWHTHTDDNRDKETLHRW